MHVCRCDVSPFMCGLKEIPHMRGLCLSLRCQRLGGSPSRHCEDANDGGDSDQSVRGAQKFESCRRQVCRVFFLLGIICVCLYAAIYRCFYSLCRVFDVFIKDSDQASTPRLILTCGLVMLFCVFVNEIHKYFLATRVSPFCPFCF